MKRSSVVKLVLVTSLFTACTHKTPQTKNLFVRTDSTSVYSRVPIIPNSYVHFYGYDIFGRDVYYNSYSRHYYGSYIHGYHSDGMSERSGSFSRAVSRGGFGSSSFKAGS